MPISSYSSDCSIDFYVCQYVPSFIGLNCQCWRIPSSAFCDAEWFHVVRVSCCVVWGVVWVVRWSGGGGGGGPRESVKWSGTSGFDSGGWELPRNFVCLTTTRELEARGLEVSFLSTTSKSMFGIELFLKIWVEVEKFNYRNSHDGLALCSRLPLQIDLPLTFAPVTSLRVTSLRVIFVQNRGCQVTSALMLVVELHYVIFMQALFSPSPLNFTMLLFNDESLPRKQPILFSTSTLMISGFTVSRVVSSRIWRTERMAKHRSRQWIPTLPDFD